MNKKSPACLSLQVCWGGQHKLCAWSLGSRDSWLGGKSSASQHKGGAVKCAVGQGIPPCEAEELMCW